MVDPHVGGRDADILQHLRRALLAPRQDCEMRERLTARALR